MPPNLPQPALPPTPGSQGSLHPLEPEHHSIFSRFYHKLSHYVGVPAHPGDPDVHATQLPKRTIYVNIPVPESDCDFTGKPIAKWPDNVIRTAKYTVLTFVPRNLFEQFRRLANVYFLFTVIMQVFPMFGVASPILAAMPLIIIMGITGIKDAFEDWRRHKTDNMVNYAKTLTLANWQSVHRRVRRKRWWRPQRLDRSRIGQGDYARNIGSRAQSAVEDVPASIVASPADNKLPLPYARQRRPPVAASGWCPPFRQRNTSQTVTPYLDCTETAGTSQLLKGWNVSAWKDVGVGDFILLRCDDRVPADVLVVATDDAASACFVETKGLDGETNLKCCEGLKETAHIRTASDCKAAQFVVNAESPTLNLYSFSGTLTMHNNMKQIRVDDVNAPDPQKTVPINIQNILLRGSTLRNTEWVIAFVLFTGRETKVILNAGQTPSKRSLIEKLMNAQVVMNFVILVIMCIIIAIFDSQLSKEWAEEAPPWMFNIDTNFTKTSVYTFFASMIMLQNVVPISLYITIEGVKTIQAYFIYSDVKMYYEPTDDACVPKSWNISDDLGQVEFIFSDKTGTLTQNKMEFLRCSIAGVTYGEGYTDVTADEEGIDTKTRAKRMDEMSGVMKNEMRKIWPNPYVVAPVGFVDKEICKQYINDPAQRREINMFFIILAVCHTVVSPKELIDNTAHPITYSAQSPDEQALVAGAKDFGVIFTARAQDIVSILVHGVPRSYRVLSILEFTSTRKRMSVIVQLVQEPHTVYLFTKGADSVLYPRLADGQQALQDTTFQHLEKFANEGLRTLVLAYRVLPTAEVRRWCEIYHKAACALTNRDTELEAAAELIEVDLTLVGATAIEDKLQDQVPECITLLRSAGIKIWVLTGDKLETALNISFAANLLHASQTLLVLRAHTPLTIVSQLRETYAQLQNPTNEVAMIIDGESLGHALGTEEGQKLLLEVGTRCVCVVCCRVSPKQKAQVVRLVKRGKNVMCAAIGDGANDVSMIQEANIGIGISGQEGLQAALAADYVIAQFRYLSRLVLVHGRWSYYRTSATILNFFYKNMTWVFTLFWYQIYCGFSGKILFDYTYLMFFNLFFTSLPALILGIFDQDVNPHYALSIPPLYSTGLKRELFTTKRFLLSVFDALYQSVICFFVPYLTSPLDWGADQLGTLVALCVIATVNLGVGLSIKNWTWVVWVSIGASVGSFIVYVPLYAAFPGTSAQGMLPSTYGNLAFWAALILTIVMALGPRVLWAVEKSVSRHPGDLEIIRERQKYNLGIPPRMIRVGKTEADIVLVDEAMVGRRASLRQLELLHSQPSTLSENPISVLPPVTVEEPSDEEDWDEEDLQPSPPPGHSRQPSHHRQASTGRSDVSQDLPTFTDLESQHQPPVTSPRRQRKIRSAPPANSPAARSSPRPAICCTPPSISWTRARSRPTRALLTRLTIIIFRRVK
ncbi:phospholipid-translocating P-type ATPase [Powellomyces hirtus]|nr:phospholipid-translocating P-type ATPase [Powellomyces hirtus]